MTKTATLRSRRPRGARPTMRLLQRSIERLQERVEDLEDLRELEQAITENGSKPLVPWDQAKKELGIA